MAGNDSGFERLKVWQYSRLLCREVHPVALMAQRRRDYALGQQLNRAALSTMANIAEGYLRRTRREFVPFIRIAAGSNGEVGACLYAAFDREYVAADALAHLLDRSNEVGRMLQGLLTAVQRAT